MMTAKPNILFIMTDQQSRHMMSCAGNGYVNTPAMDSMAEVGTRFTRAYCTNPVCVPSRFSLFTGRMPSEIKLQNNGPVRAPERIEAIKPTGLGWTLKGGGYRALYAGKQHFPRMTAEDLGFDVLTEDERDELAEVTSAFVRQHQGEPWCLVASFINPHDICYMAIRDHAEGDTQQGIMQRGSVPLGELDRGLASAEGIPEETFFDEHCPPVPPNHDPQEGEPEALPDLLASRAFRLHARENWDETKWRMHRWAYARLTDRVDGQIALLLDALRSGPAAENTVVIFTSDHGDHDSSHRMEHKTYPYEEAAGVPLIICDPARPVGVVDETSLVSNGLDLFPTVCDYAGIAVPPHIEGVSLRPLVEGRPVESAREVVKVECEVGNAVVSDRYKYLKCFDGANAEQLYDLKMDPHETRNAADDPGQEDALELHRRYFSELFLK
jgi:arylsulfatase A-like enzyme